MLPRARPWALFLLALNTAAHFLPLERASVAPDDYAHLVQVETAGAAESLRTALHDRERPLNRLFMVGQAVTVGADARRALLPLIASSTLVALAAFAFLSAVLGSRAWGFVASAVYCLLPQTVEIHHTAIFINVNVATALYALSGAAFLRYLETPRRRLWLASLLLYAAGVLWYEVGVFLPVLLLLAAHRRSPERRRDVAGFLVVAAVVFAYRFLAPAAAETGLHRAVGFNVRPAVTLAHHYLGLLLLRTVGYGLYCFGQLPAVWMAAAVAADVLLVRAWARLARPLAPVPPADDGVVARSACSLSAVAFVVFLLPLFLQARGGIAGRHLSLPSLGVAGLVACAAATGRVPRVVLGALVAIGLVVAQGNAWAQVVACRLNAAVFQTVRGRQPELSGAARVVFDLASFVDAIPATWVPLPHDRLNTYYGAQAFEEWGLRAMVHLTTHDDLPVHMAVERPRSWPPDGWAFQEGFDLGLRAFSTRMSVIPRAGTVTIGFADVYPRGFLDGRSALSGR